MVQRRYARFASLRCLVAVVLSVLGRCEELGGLAEKAADVAFLEGMEQAVWAGQTDAFVRGFDRGLQEAGEEQFHHIKNYARYENVVAYTALTELTFPSSEQFRSAKRFGCAVRPHSNLTFPRVYEYNSPIQEYPLVELNSAGEYSPQEANKTVGRMLMTGRSGSRAGIRPEHIMKRIKPGVEVKIAGVLGDSRYWYAEPFNWFSFLLIVPTGFNDMALDLGIIINNDKKVLWLKDIPGMWLGSYHYLTTELGIPDYKPIYINFFTPFDSYGFSIVRLDSVSLTWEPPVWVGHICFGEVDEKFITVKPQVPGSDAIGKHFPAVDVPVNMSDLSEMAP